MSGANEIQIDVDRQGETAIVTPLGEIDLARSPYLRARLAEFIGEQPKNLVVNLAEVPYMDSSGVATLVEALQQCRASGISLKLCGLQERVRSIFEIARLDMVFTIESTVDAALDT